MKEIKSITGYKIVKKIADGGMGSVYLALQCGEQGFAKVVALKTIKKQFMKDEVSRKFFISEAKLVADLIHENILQVYQLGKVQDLTFMVMEYAYGQDLSGMMKAHKAQGRQFDIEMAAFITSRVSRALNYAHNARDIYGNTLNIVHRDISPGNILITYDGVVKLTDFGIAKAITNIGPDEGRFILGKIPYMAPEQVTFQGSSPLSDIYSLGLVAYLMLTNKIVHRGTTIKERIVNLKNLTIISPSKLNNDIPKSLSDIVMACLERDPKNRIQNAKELTSLLEHYMYDKGYGPTNEKLQQYVRGLFPGKKFQGIGVELPPLPSAS